MFSNTRGYGEYQGYEGCHGLYPASGRLQSVPPRYYDLVDGDTGRVIASDSTYRNRARSQIRSQRLAEEASWGHGAYSDMVVGSTGHPGHFAPRSSGEYSRDILSRSRSPSPVAEHINHMNRDMIDANKEMIHQSKMRNRFPETFRGQSSSYNPTLGRYQTSYDSPGFRFYRYDNTKEPPRFSHTSVDRHMPRFSTRNRERITVPPVCPDISALTRRVKIGA